MVVLEILVILVVIGWQVYLLLQNKNKARRLEQLFISVSEAGDSSRQKFLAKIPYQLRDEGGRFQLVRREGEFYQVREIGPDSDSSFLLDEAELEQLLDRSDLLWMAEEGTSSAKPALQWDGGEDLMQVQAETNKLLTTYQGIGLTIEQLMEPAVSKRQELEGSLQATVSTPLYVGLLGTFLGVAIGLSAVMLDGLEEGAIDRLLLGVTIAMSGSFCGLLFSLLSGSWLREADRQSGEGLKAWRSYLQGLVGTQLSQDFAGSLQGLKGVLQSFNQDFLVRVADFKDTFSQLYQYTEQQERFLAALKEADVHKMSEANLAFFEKIKQNEDLFERLGQYLSSLNESLDNGRQATRDIREVVSHLKQVGDVQHYLQQNEELIRRQLGYLGAHQEKMDALTHSIQQHFVEAGDEISKLVQQRLQMLKQQEQDAGEELRAHFERLRQENVYERIAEQLQPIRQMKADTESLKALFADTLTHLLETQKYIIRKINQDASLQQQLLSRMDTLNQQLEKLNEPKGLWHRLTGR